MPPAAKTKVLIAVKTYPSLSRKYGELVCTAGFREDGSWIRIYPIPFRLLPHDARFKKYQWIEVELERNQGHDYRPESHKVLNFDRIQLLEDLPTDHEWRRRREFVLRDVKTNMASLIAEAKRPDKRTSLATFKPAKVLDFVCKPVPADWDPRQLAQYRQTDLFRDYGDLTEIVEKIPWRFSMKFQDAVGRVSHLMLEDWETTELYRNQVRRGDPPEVAAEKVRRKYLGFAEKNDLHFFLGTTLRHHLRSRNPFIIIGVFYPPFAKPDLFDGAC